MVPVPEEHADAVKRYVAWADAGRETTPWDGSSLSDVLAGLPPPGRDLVSLVAQVTLEGDPLSIPDAGHRLGRTAREILGTIVEVNHLAPPRSGSGYLLQLQPVGTELLEQLVAMDTSTAQSVRAALRATA